MSSTAFTTDYADYSTESTPCELGTTNTLGHTFRPVLLWLLCIAGSLGNGLVLWVLLARRARNMADVCLLNLASADLLLALLLPLWTYTPISTTEYEMAEDGSTEDEMTEDGTTEDEGHMRAVVLCKVMAGVHQLGFFSGLLFVMAMSLDRYLAVVHAVVSSPASRRRYSLVASGVVWASAMTLGLLKAFLTTAYQEEGVCDIDDNLTDTATWRLALDLGEVVMTLGVCLPTLTFCYARILTVVRQQRSAKKRRAIWLIFAIVCAFALFWVPYQLTLLVTILERQGVLETECQQSQQLLVALELTETLALTHCCINPILYAFVAEKFRRNFALAFARLPLCLKLCPVAPLPLSSSKPSENDTSNTGMSSARCDGYKDRIHMDTSHI